MSLAKPIETDATLADVRRMAARCRTPEQFRALLNALPAYLPFNGLICGWGYPGSYSIGFVLNHGVPREFVRWFLSRGMLPRSPMFREWMRVRRPQLLADVMKRRRYGPEHVKLIERYNLLHTLGGGTLGRQHWVYFAMTMASEAEGRAHLERFRRLLPALSAALRRACPRPLLTRRERAILERRAMGESIKRIAGDLSIAERTVRMHLTQAKRKLYTDDLVNAVVIAVRSGMLDETWRELRLVRR